MSVRNPVAVERAYDQVPPHVKANVFEAKRWAQRRLTDREGRGHHIVLSRNRPGDRSIVCSFAKPSWAGDHSGTPCQTGAEAIVRAVLEYECGY